MATPTEENGSSRDPKLSEVFDDGLQLHLELEECDYNTSSKAYQDNLKKATYLLEKATRMVSELSLFSANEEIEELPTSDMRYLLLPALLGDLTLKVTGGDRLEVVQKGMTYFVDYLNRCRQYGVTQEEIPEAGAAPVVHSGRPNLMAMQANREAKIRKYRQAKETRDKLSALGTWSEIRGKDEDVQRNFYLLYVKSWVDKSLEQIESIHQELELLQHEITMTESRGACADNQKPPTLPNKPMKPFILTRDAIQAQVFGAGYPSIPTMTLEEFYQKEIREGKINLDSHNPTAVSERQQAEDAEVKKETQIETDDPEALAKARQWDDWKDDHKRGWGNRENMG